MLVEKPISTCSYIRILNVGIALFFTLTTLIPLSAFIFSVLFDTSDLHTNAWSSIFFKDNGNEKRKGSLTGKKIENSFIFLNNNEMKMAFLPNFEKQFVLLQHVARPDLVKKEDLYLVGLESSHEKRLASQGEKIFLTCKDDEEIFFAKRETPFWCQFYLKENKEVEVHLFADLKGEDKTSLYSYNQVFKTEFKKDFIQSGESEKNELAPLSAFLKRVKVTEPDLLIQMYGGKTFDSVKGLYRMSSDSKCFYIKQGDLFVWRGENLEQEKSRTQNHPLLLVKSLDSYNCEVVLWDSEGIYNKSITIPVGKTSGSSIKIGDFFHKIHQRTDASVTCQLDRRNVIIRKGDWFLMDKGHFRNLRTAEEIKDYLRYRIKGELFIFDGIVKKEGVTLFAGHLFNEERTVLKKVEIPLAERKKAPPIKKKETKVAPQQVKDE